jgi:hypothetical protein
MQQPAPREFFQSQLSLRNFLNHRHTRQEMLRKYSGPGKKVLRRNAPSCGSKVKSGHPVRGASLQDKSLFLNFWSQILIWNRCTHQLRVWSRVLGGSFCTTVLHPGIFYDEYLFLFLRCSSITHFANLMNSEPFILFLNYISKISWSQFRISSSFMGWQIWISTKSGVWGDSKGPGAFFLVISRSPTLKTQDSKFAWMTSILLNYPSEEHNRHIAAFPTKLWSETTTINQSTMIWHFVLSHRADAMIITWLKGTGYNWFPKLPNTRVLNGQQAWKIHGCNWREVWGCRYWESVLAVHEEWMDGGHNRRTDPVLYKLKLKGSWSI